MSTTQTTQERLEEIPTLEEIENICKICKYNLDNIDKANKIFAEITKIIKDKMPEETPNKEYLKDNLTKSQEYFSRIVQYLNNTKDTSLADEIYSNCINTLLNISNNLTKLLNDKLIKTNLANKVKDKFEINESQNQDENQYKYKYIEILNVNEFVKYYLNPNDFYARNLLSLAPIFHPFMLGLEISFSVYIFFELVNLSINKFINPELNIPLQMIIGIGIPLMISIAIFIIMYHLTKKKMHFNFLEIKNQCSKIDDLLNNNLYPIQTPLEMKLLDCLINKFKD